MYTISIKKAEIAFRYLCKTESKTLFLLRTVITVLFLESCNFINYTQYNIKAVANSIYAETLRHISPGMIVICKNRILCSKGNRFYSCL